LIVSYLPEPEKHPLWNDIRELLRPAAEYGKVGVLETGDLVWIALDGSTVFAAATTCPMGREAMIVLAAGSRHREWIADFEGQVSAWAKANGAEKLTMRGRKGWGRYARPFGWVVLGTDEDGLTIYEKAL
jgi:hypothetical protein